MVLATALFALTFIISEAIGVRLCGKQLADMLDLVCEGRGFHWSPREDRISGSPHCRGIDMTWSGQQTPAAQYYQSGVPQLRKRNAVQYLLTTPPSPSIEVGIVTECCRKACSIQDMESYCAAAPGTFLANPTNAPLSRELANEIISSGLRTAHPLTVQATHAPPTTPPPNRSAPPRPRILSPFSGNARVRPNGMQRTAGLLSNIFFFVRPVGPRPTRTPVVSL